MQKIKFTPFRWEFAHTRNGGNFTFYRATARDRVSFAHEVAWLVVFRAHLRAGNLLLALHLASSPSFPRRSPPNSWRSPPHATLFPLFLPKRCLFRSFHASYLPYFVKSRPQSNSFFYINAQALLLKQTLLVLMQLFFTLTPI